MSSAPEDEQAGSDTAITPGQADLPRRRARRMGSRDAILDAATALFLHGGYAGTSVDAVAAKARVSKQTIYTHFADKKRLLREVVLRNAETSEPFIDAIDATIAEAGSFETGLMLLGRRYLATVLRAEVVQLRRLVICEATAFPELAREYHRRVPQRVLDRLADVFAARRREGELRAADPHTTAEHFAFLVLGAALDRAMFSPADAPPTPRELETMADAGVSAFLAAYGA